MAKQKDLKIDVKTSENEININRTAEKTEVKVDTKNIDIDYYKDENTKKFNYDGKKLDVSVTKEGDNTEIKIDASSGFLQKLGKLLSKIIFRKFNK